MNAQKAKKLADDFYNCSIQNTIDEYIERAAKLGRYEITSGLMCSTLASSLKNALKSMGYEVEKCRVENTQPEDEDGYYLKIRWD